MADDWSYKYGKPRSQVHYERYGSRSVPARKGKAGNPSNPVNWVVIISGVAAILSGLVMIYEGVRQRV